MTRKIIYYRVKACTWKRFSGPLILKFLCLFSHFDLDIGILFDRRFCYAFCKWYYLHLFSFDKISTRIYFVWHTTPNILLIRPTNYFTLLSYKFVVFLSEKLCMFFQIYAEVNLVLSIFFSVHIFFHEHFYVNYLAYFLNTIKLLLLIVYHIFYEQSIFYY